MDLIQAPTFHGTVFLSILILLQINDIKLRVKNEEGV